MPTMEEKAKCPEGIILGCGNPLLDIQVQVTTDFLKKWNLKENDAILVDDQRLPMFEELVNRYEVAYIPGGATQNSLRVCQWILKEPNRATFFGAIGNDKYGEILRQKAQEAGLNVCYQVKEGQKTGTCAALITSEHRSLCAHLAAANSFTVDHLEHPANRDLIERAQYFYISGFFVTACPAAIMTIARHASAHNKPFERMMEDCKFAFWGLRFGKATFSMNLAAPFIPKLFRNEFLEVLPYVDILFGNESEGDAFADANDYDTHDLRTIGAKIAAFSKVNEKRQRIVVLTQGANPTLVFQGNEVEEYPVSKLKREEIIDTNGAGDAFVGGFLSQYVQHKSVVESIKCGHYAAAAIIRQQGCTFPPTCLYH